MRSLKLTLNTLAFLAIATSSSCSKSDDIVVNLDNLREFKHQPAERPEKTITDSGYLFIANDSTTNKQ